MGRMVSAFGGAVRAVARGVAGAVRARPGAVTLAATGVLALDTLLPPLLLSLARAPWTYFTFNPWLKRLPEYLASSTPWSEKLDFLSRVALFWFSADGLEWRRAGQIDNLATTQRWAPALFSVGNGLFFSFDANDMPGATGPWSGYTTTDGDVWHALAFDEAAVVGSGARRQRWS